MNTKTRTLNIAGRNLSVPKQIHRRAGPRCGWEVQIMGFSHMVYDKDHGDQAPDSLKAAIQWVRELRKASNVRLLAECQAKVRITPFSAGRFRATLLYIPNENFGLTKDLGGFDNAHVKFNHGEIREFLLKDVPDWLPGSYRDEAFVHWRKKFFEIVDTTVGG